MTQNFKTCIHCKVESSTDNFHKNKANKDGLAGQCKSCRAKQTFKYDRSPAGKASKSKWQSSSKGKDAQRRFRSKKKHSIYHLIASRYLIMLQRSRDKGFNIIDRDLFVKWSISDKQLNTIYSNWDKETDMDMPTVDRIDNNKGYVEGNIQWLTRIDNIRKGVK